MASMVELSLEIDYSQNRIANLRRAERKYQIAGLVLITYIVACMVWALTFINKNDFSRG